MHYRHAQNHRMHSESRSCLLAWPTCALHTVGRTPFPHVFSLTKGLPAVYWKGSSCQASAAQPHKLSPACAKACSAVHCGSGLRQGCFQGRLQLRMSPTCTGICSIGFSENSSTCHRAGGGRQGCTRASWAAQPCTQPQLTAPASLSFLALADAPPAPQQGSALHHLIGPTVPHRPPAETHPAGPPLQNSPRCAAHPRCCGCPARP